jgi:hypothetical protein
MQFELRFLTLLLLKEIKKWCFKTHKLLVGLPFKTLFSQRKLPFLNFSVPFYLYSKLSIHNSS